MRGVRSPGKRRMSLRERKTRSLDGGDIEILWSKIRSQKVSLEGKDERKRTTIRA